MKNQTKFKLSRFKMSSFTGYVSMNVLMRILHKIILCAGPYPKFTVWDAVWAKQEIVRKQVVM